MEIWFLNHLGCLEYFTQDSCVKVFYYHILLQLMSSRCCSGLDKTALRGYRKTFPFFFFVQICHSLTSAGL